MSRARRKLPGKMEPGRLTLTEAGSQLLGGPYLIIDEWCHPVYSDMYANHETAMAVLRETVPEGVSWYVVGLPWAMTCVGLINMSYHDDQPHGVPTGEHRRGLRQEVHDSLDQLIGEAS